MKAPKNINYAAIVVEIKTLIPLEKCDFVQAAIIMGNQVIVGKDVKIGDIGLYFPLECALSKEYLSNNNLYRKPELNVDDTKKGYFEENGRIRCVKFRGHNSEGLFMPINSLSFIFPNNNKTVSSGLWYPKEFSINVGDCFDELNGTPICSKYVVKQNRVNNPSKSRNSKNDEKFESKLVENQFRFHQDTEMLYRNLYKINPESLISISYKLHGTSGISSYILCKRKLNWREKLVKRFGIKVIEEEYDYVYSSRKVIKNENINPNTQSFYSEDIWGIAHKELEGFLQKGMTFYYEIVGFLPNGGMIQKDYDYGCKSYSNGGSTAGGCEHAIYIYRITQTNIEGKVFEFSAKQVQDFCKKNGLNAVPELYYGYAKDIFTFEHGQETYADADYYTGNEHENEYIDIFRESFLNCIKQKYNEKDCYMCENIVPEEGCVIRVEGNSFEAFKQKSTCFYERETKQLDKGEIDIESNEE